MAFTFNGQDYEDPVILVDDRDGDQMPFHPQFGPDDFESLPADLSDWGHWWCACGHLVMDHHVDSLTAATTTPITMGCWAVGCDCRIGVG